LYGLAADRVSNPRVVKGFGQQKREHLSFFRISARLFRRSLRIVLLRGGLQYVLTFLTRLCLGVVLGYGAWLLWQGELSVGYLLLCYGATGAMMGPLSLLSVLPLQTQHLAVVFERVLEVLGEPVTLRDSRRAEPMQALEDGVRFRDVTLQYPGTTRPALEDVSFHVPRGSHLCIMGRSGAGKSTLMTLLLRLYDTDSGQVLFDGRDVREISNASLRRHVAYVPQEPVLFSGTIAENITYGVPSATMEQVVHAAKAAEIHEYIASLPDGYQTLIGENGLRLSGGQKQRISIARALVTDPEVLALDDCTSALDAHTEARIRRTLRFALQGRTVLMISHRVSSAAAADKVLVLQDGRVAEYGTHEQLLEQGDAYRRLVEPQLREAVEDEPALADPA
jgi:ABC-type multidrug transport system fused ATPase/permease subunit